MNSNFQYYDELARSFVGFHERLPVSDLEWIYLTVSVVMVVGIFRCLCTTGRRFFGSDWLIFKLHGWMLVLLTIGQAIVAIALMERALSGAMNEATLITGIVAWLIGRYSLQAMVSFKKKIAQKKKL